MRCVAFDVGHQKKLMLAVEKLKRISGATLRHSRSRHHCVTSSPPNGDVKDTQGQNDGTLKAVRRHTPPANNYCSSVVPINVCQSAALLPVTSQKPLGCYYDDVITSTNDRCVTSFGVSDGTDRRNTGNYFGGWNACNGMVNVNGVCFSVYGTLPRNLVRRHNKLGQGQVQGHKLNNTLCDDVTTLRRQPVPSPPKRTNSIKTNDLQRPSENDLQSTLTRRPREATPGECELNEKASDNELSRSHTTTTRTRRSWCSTTGNECSLAFANECSDTIKHCRTTPTAAVEGREDSDSANCHSRFVPDEVFDSGTVKRRQKCPINSASQHTPSVVTNDVHSSVNVKDVVDLEQQFDVDTLKRQNTVPPADDSRYAIVFYF